MIVEDADLVEFRPAIAESVTSSKSPTSRGSETTLPEPTTWPKALRRMRPNPVAMPIVLSVTPWDLEWGERLPNLSLCCYKVYSMAIQ